MNPYETLGIKRTDDLSVIKTAYQQSLLKYHPDKCGANEGSHNTEKFHLIQQAWKLLNDKALKNEYDQKAKQDSAKCGATEVNLSEFEIEPSEIEVEVEEEITNSRGEKEIRISYDTAIVDLFVKLCRCGDRFEVT